MLEVGKYVSSYQGQTFTWGSTGISDMWLVNLKNLHACANMIVVLSFFIINTNYDNKFHMIF